LYVPWLVRSSTGVGDGLAVAVVVSVPIWIGVQSVVIGAFETIVVAVGGFATVVGKALVCSAARLSWRRCIFVAFFDVVSVSEAVTADCTGTVCASGWTAVSPFASRAITATLNAPSVSRKSAGKGIPSSLGQSRCNRQLFSSICARVTVSGSHQFGAVAAVVAVVAVTGAVGFGSTAALHRLRARSFLLAFFPNCIHGYRKRKMLFTNGDSVQAVGCRLYAVDSSRLTETETVRATCSW